MLGALEAVRISAIVEKLSKRAQLDLAHGRTALSDSCNGMRMIGTDALPAKAGVGAACGAGTREIVHRRGAYDQIVCTGVRLWDAAEGADVLLLLAGILAAYSVTSLLRDSRPSR